MASLSFDTVRGGYSASAVPRRTSCSAGVSAGWSRGSLDLVDHPAREIGFRCDLGFRLDQRLLERLFRVVVFQPADLLAPKHPLGI
jgi:hypothetical protein